MEEFYNKLIELAEKSQVERRVSVQKGNFLVQNSEDRVPKMIIDGQWDIENFFHNSEWIAQRQIITLENGVVYEDRLSLFQGFYNL